MSVPIDQSEGWIESPQYPHDYPSNAECDWLLQTSSGYRIDILFDDFDVGASQIDTCNDGELEVKCLKGYDQGRGTYDAIWAQF